METIILLLVAFVFIISVGIAIRVDSLSDKENINNHIKEYVKCIMHLRVRQEVHDVAFDMIYNPHNWSGEVTLTDDYHIVWAANGIVNRTLWRGEKKDENELDLTGDEKFLLNLGVQIVKTRLKALEKKTEIPY